MMPVPSAAGSRPNILWISLEDTSPRFGCYGDELARTPHLDGLAAQGRRYPDAFCTSAVCAPSRFAIITGVYATSAGAHHMRTTSRHDAVPEMPTPYEPVPPSYVKTFTEYLRAAGYFCTNNKKTDYQFSSPRTAWDISGDEAHWRRRQPGQPFFAVFNPTMTHESGMWTERQTGPLTTDPAAVSLPPYLPDTPKVREALARHYDNLAAADAVVGRLLRELDEDGLTAETIVFIWSDHGEGLPRGKRWPYDSGIRIPLIVRWPGRLQAGSVDPRLVSLIDLGPTVLSLAGLEIPSHLQGVPFLGPHARDREYVYAHRDRHDTAYDMMRAVRDQRFKYIRNYQPEQAYLLWIPYRNRHPVMQELWRLHAAGGLEGAQRLLFTAPRPVEELYDCHEDPWEVRNLAGEPAHQQTLARLRGALDRWQHETGDLGHLPEALLAERMWPGGEQPHTAAPIFGALGPDQDGTETTEGGAFPGPVCIQLHCATQGASIAFRINDESGPWRLYTGPIPLAAGTTTLRARANRIGYAESPERRATFTVERAAGP